jgi:hypothetical protein
MPLFGYPFNITGRQINPQQLSDEIAASEITIALINCSVVQLDGDNKQLTANFKAELPDADESILNTLVTDHVANFETPANMILMGHTVPTTGEVVEGPYAGDGKLRVLASHKPVIPGKESWNYFCSTGDLVASGTVGGGTPMLVECTSGTPVSQVDFEFLNNSWPSEYIYIFGGAIAWENAGSMDCFNMEIRAKPTPVVPAVVASGLGLDVDYNVVGDKVVYAGPGAGSHALGGLPVMVQNFSQTGTWDLDRSTMTPIPNTGGTGSFDWFVTDVRVGNYISDLLVRGTNYAPQIIDATESAPVPYGYYFRLKCHNNSNTDWSLWGFLRIYRERLQ